MAIKGLMARFPKQISLIALGDDEIFLASSDCDGFIVVKNSSVSISPGLVGWGISGGFIDGSP